MIKCAITQDARCKYGWVCHDECKLCGGPGTESTGEGKNLWLQLSEEVNKLLRATKGAG